MGIRLSQLVVCQVKWPVSLTRLKPTGEAVLRLRFSVPQKCSSGLTLTLKWKALTYK